MRRGVEVLCGFVTAPVPREKNDSSSDEEEGEEEFDDFMDTSDVRDVAEGGTLIRASFLKPSTGIYIHNPNPYHCITGIWKWILIYNLLIMYVTGLKLM